jgi:branched-chain amino acid transport system ATP-binding protein
VLSLEAIETYYGASQVLFGVSLEVGQGEVVTLLGRNGMGKTTTVRSIMGMTPIRAGTITLDRRAIHTLPPYRVAQSGLGLVPEGRQIFPNLTVRENLLATSANRSASATPWTLEGIYTLFPSLAARQQHMGNQLSGGEQQMVAIGRALMTNPRLLILDEATEGLAPLLRAEIWRVLAHLKSAGQSILLIDKHVAALTRIADRHYILEKGRVVWSGTSAALRADAAVRQRYLGV